MDNLVINSDKINDYISKMLDIMTRFIDEIDKMESYSSKLIWVSDNRDEIIKNYESELKDYYNFASNACKIIEYLGTYADKYSECIKTIKDKLAILNEKLDLGDKYD